MSTLAHYFEREGFATSLISLIPMHTEKIQSPRALAVPFELGRPYGAVGDAAFQRRVLEAQIDLFDRESGPVFEEFDDDPPDVAGKPGWNCSVSLPPRFENLDDLPGLRKAFLAEIQDVRPRDEEAV